MKKTLPRSRVEKILIMILCILTVFTAGGLLFLSHYFNKEELLKSQRGNADETSLDDITAIFPENCNINEKIPDIRFTNESGDIVTMKDFLGKPAIITFWASWCPDCRKELSHIREFLNTSKVYGDINYILINRTDNKKETKETAKRYLSEQGIAMDTYYDKDMTACQELGLHAIPTTLFLDEHGVIRSWSIKPIEKTSVFEGYLKDLTEGSGKVTGDFVRNHLMDDRGGVHTIYDPEADSAIKSDVLSETQGVMLEYALLRKDQQLFEKILSYINGVMRVNGITSWNVSNDKPSEVNSLLDDFRILGALLSANDLWGGYDQLITSYSDEIAKYGIHNRNYVDFYDSGYKKYADRFTLCYGDLPVMSRLAVLDERFTQPYESAKKLILGGKISEGFPLYYSWYDYNKNSYVSDDLNTAEAMVTLLHLAEAGLLGDDTIAWLKTQMDAGGVKARYKTDGTVVEGYNYDSTAVYALIAMIGEIEGDKKLQGKALKKMEKMRIMDTAYPYYGAFGLEDGSGITSFDQVMAMLAYEYTGKPAD
ncbi:thiol-disulfide isomerase/thioredoxin [Lacrimispora xylanisolvens]|uniref:Thiol-disulfide isomerase/thioredoxin n=1 Tax=Lacrimispora xylanisolvens TaxID=384636 RepID=A0A2S6HZH3_9FIRM|nr:TlpA disulfide reductase family protein [Hungatella xylanolytica]PPK83460.1 thiol-disulfide isomerase/thioredoxin [Hungatella xylanolytica]